MQRGKNQTASQIFTMLNKRTMNNSSRQHDQLDNCSSYSNMSIASSRHRFSSLLLTKLEICHSHEIRTLQHVYSGLYSLHSFNPLLNRSCSVYNKGITQFYLPLTHEPYLPLLPSCKASPSFGWYSLRLSTKGWPGWVDLSGCPRTEIMSCTGNWTLIRSPTSVLIGPDVD